VAESAEDAEKIFNSKIAKGSKGEEEGDGED